MTLEALGPGTAASGEVAEEAGAGGQGPGDRLASVSPPPCAPSRAEMTMPGFTEPFSQKPRRPPVSCVSEDNRCLSRGNNCLKHNWTTPQEVALGREGAWLQGMGVTLAALPVPMIL